MLNITNKIIGLFQVGSGGDPEPAGFTHFTDATLAALADRGLLKLNKSQSQPSDKTGLWLTAPADPKSDVGELKIPVNDAFVAPTQDNFAAFLCERGGAFTGVQTGNLAMNFYTSAAVGTLTIPTNWITYSYFNVYLDSGNMMITGASAQVRADSGKDTVVGNATSAGQAMIFAVRET